MRTKIKINGQCQVYSESTTPRLLWNIDRLRRSVSPSNSDNNILYSLQNLFQIFYI